MVMHTSRHPLPDRGHRGAAVRTAGCHHRPGAPRGPLRRCEQRPAPRARATPAAPRPASRRASAGSRPDRAGNRLAMRSMPNVRCWICTSWSRPDGAVVAGWYPGWDYAWPRDSSWVAVALAVTRHGADALRVADLPAERAEPGRHWAARYEPDGGGRSATRPVELDAVGWVPWAVWSWYEADRSPRRGASWPAVANGQRGSERAEQSLPRVVCRCRHRLLGARHAGNAGDGRAAADRPAGRGDIAGALAPETGCSKTGPTPQHGCHVDPGFVRLLWIQPAAGRFQRSGRVGHLPRPPFGPASAALEHAEEAAERRAHPAGGGVLPGADWPGRHCHAWTAETAFSALSDAANGEHGRAGTLLSWLAAHRTALGALPEQVTAAGRPASVARWPGVTPRSCSPWSRRCGHCPRRRCRPVVNRRRRRLPAAAAHRRRPLARPICWRRPKSSRDAGLRRTRLP